MEVSSGFAVSSRMSAPMYRRCVTCRVFYVDDGRCKRFYTSFVAFLLRQTFKQMYADLYN